jgi:predicted AlkP superfamily phosphohydrolase/phosphomutase
MQQYDQDTVETRGGRAKHFCPSAAKALGPPLLAAFLVLCLPAVAHAYIGPGAGFALVTSFLSFVIAFFAAFFTVLTYPVRMLVKRIRRKRIPGRPRVKKVIVLGLDGLDPEICERLMSKGELPNFSHLASHGSFRRLGTSTPAMSPVAWSTFSTGTDASGHGIFDFLALDPASYAPVLSSSRVTASKRVLRLGPFKIPLGGGSIRFLRRSKSFWKILGEYGIFSTILRVPITFPPERFNGVMLSGMCVPDLRGTMGSFTYLTEDAGGPEESSDPPGDSDGGQDGGEWEGTGEQGVRNEKIGGFVLRLEREGNLLVASLPGPENPVSDGKLTLPLEIRIDSERGGAEIRISSERFFLREGEYSQWIRLSFRAAPGVTLRGIARFYITKLEKPFGLYVSPIHIDPEKPAMPISHPGYYSIYLAKRQGTYGTLGLAEDTWAVNEHVLDGKAFIDQAYLFHHERECMFLGALGRMRQGLTACVFDLSDRMQHMFFKYLLENEGDSEEIRTGREALYEMYREMDRLLGKTRSFVDEGTALIVMSDHGFKSFRRGVDINAWLASNGYLAWKERTAGGEYLTDVDWSRTRAFALGLGGIYLNRRGREREGIVRADETGPLKEEIASSLLSLVDGQEGGPVVSRIFNPDNEFSGPYRSEGPDLIVGLAEGYRISWNCARGKKGDAIIEDNTRSWSGDHCIDPALVPGVLFTTLRCGTENPNIVDIAPSILRLFGIDPPGYMTGRDIFESEGRE